MTDTEKLLAAIGELENSLGLNLGSLTELIHKHNETLYGNGHPGLTTRVTLVEAAQKRLKWLAATVMGAAIVMVFDLVRDLITK